MTTNYALSGQAAADKQRYVSSLVFSTLTGPIGLISTYLTTPVPTRQVLQDGPTDPAAQQVFISAYTARAKSLRVRRAWQGAILCPFFYLTLFAACFAPILYSQLTGSYERRPTPGAAPEQTSPVFDERREDPVASEEQRRGELVASADATREEVSTLIAEIETVYEDVFRTHQAAADALTDEWEKRWALDRVTTDRWLRDQRIENIQRELAAAGPFELPGVRTAAEQSLLEAQGYLAKAQEQLQAAQER